MLDDAARRLVVLLLHRDETSRTVCVLLSVCRARDYPDVAVTSRLSRICVVSYTDSRHFIKSRRISETPRFAITHMAELRTTVIFDFRYNRHFQSRN